MGSKNKKIKETFDIQGSLSRLFIGADIIKNKNYDDVEFLVDKLFPKGTLCALVGESDTGKSSFLRQLALSIACDDSEFIGFKLNDHCKNVVYVSTEDGEMATSVWLNKYYGNDYVDNAQLSKLKYVYNIDGLVKNIGQIVEKYCVDLIIIDSYADLFSGSMNNSNEVRSFLNTYNNIANEFGVTIVFLHHTKKGTSGMTPNKNSILGSQGFEAKMRSVLMLTRDDNDDTIRHLCIVKNNYLPEKMKSMSYELKFNEHLAFENTGRRKNLVELGAESWLDQALIMKKKGLSYRDISDRLKEDGYEVSKSALQRKLN